MGTLPRTEAPDLVIDSWAMKLFVRGIEVPTTSLEFRLIDYLALGSDARLSVPTPDHYLPLLYVLGSRRKGEEVSFPIEGFDGGSMSMLAVRISESEK